MPAQPKPHFNVPRAHLEATLVLNYGYIDRCPPVPKPMPFTANEAARHQACLIAMDCMALLSNLAPTLHHDTNARHAIMRKLYQHLHTTKCQTAKAIHDFAPEALDAITHIADNPTLAFTSHGFDHIIAHAQKAFTALPKYPSDTPPRPVIWNHPDGIHALTELTHPCHLMLEGDVLQHCINRHYDENLLRKSGLTRGTPSAAACLYYWKEIEDGRSRIFSLTSNGKPRVTINYGIPQRAFFEFGGRSGLTGEEPFFPALIDAIVHMSHAFAPTYMSREALGIEPIVDHLTQRISSDCPRIFIYPQHPLELI